MARQRLNLAELQALLPGTKVHVRYVEDGAANPRLNGKFEVVENTTEMLVVADQNGPEEFPWNKWDDENQEFNDGGIGVISR